MIRPTVIRQILSHVATRRVGPYRLRSTDAERLASYLEHLESRPVPAAVAVSVDWAQLDAAAPGLRAAMDARSIVWDSDEGRTIRGVLSDMLDQAITVVPLPAPLDPVCEQCGIAHEHAIGCPAVQWA